MPSYLADENVDHRPITAMREYGRSKDDTTSVWQVHSVFEDYRGIDDDQVIALANQLNAVILTEDKDFGELTYRFGILNPGIILLRCSGTPVEAKTALIIEVLDVLEDKVYGHFTVIKHDRVRIRKLPSAR